MFQKILHGRANFIFSYNTNEITRAENFPLVFDLVVPEGGAKVGYPVRGLFSIPFVGLNSAGIPVYNDEKGGSGSAVYLQSDQTDFLKYEGPVDPTIVGGFPTILLTGIFHLVFIFHTRREIK